MKPVNIRIVLEKGASFDAQALGDFSKVRFGEFVFCTAMSGIEESLTDPSFCRQILVSTSSHIGNTGFTKEDMESSKIWVEGLICRNLTAVPSNWRAKKTLASWIVDEGKFVVSNVNTRQLTLYLREHGSQRGVLFEKGSMSDEEAVEYISEKVPPMGGAYLLDEVSVKEVEEFSPNKNEFWPQVKELELDNAEAEAKPKVLVWDFGVKKNTLRILDALGCQTVVIPARTKAADILAMRPDGILLSNGPGDPAAAELVIEEIKQLISKVPLYGICMGHQLIASALGAKTVKMKFGHRGVHHPVVEYDEHNNSGKTWITSQNHGFAVDEESLPTNVQVRFRHANDNSVEGLYAPELKCATVQFHPEAAPGPLDSVGFFTNFVKEVKNAH